MSIKGRKTIEKVCARFFILFNRLIAEETSVKEDDTITLCWRWCVLEVVKCEHLPSTYGMGSGPGAANTLPKSLYFKMRKHVSFYNPRTQYK